MEQEYTVVGYEKNGDVYEQLGLSTTDFNAALDMAKMYTKIMNEGGLARTCSDESMELFDSIEIYSGWETDKEKVIWDSGIYEIIEELNEAADAYYNSGQEIMSNFQYDALYNELVRIEKETGIILPESPTQRVGSEVVDSLPKQKHEYPAKSLDKTKDINEFHKIFSVRDGLAVVMWKMDGSTVQLTYDDGKLTSAVTRGNGEVGSVITHNAPYIKGVPVKIPYKGHLVVRGEAVMSYAEFNRLNSVLAEEDQYTNPRNLANATISMLDSREMRKRKIHFKAFKFVYSSEGPYLTFFEQLKTLKEWGFDVVDHCLASAWETPKFSPIKDVMDSFTNKAKAYEYPVDGLVVALNDVAYAESRPGTGHHPNKLVGYAFKWADTTVRTTLREIEWSASRTGLINPVAVFDPVELEGTTVSRASVHNVSILKKMRLRVGDKISVYKANMIIPQIAENLTSGEELSYEESHCVYCPSCGDGTQAVVTSDDVETCVCMNPECPAKMIGKFVHFVDREALNIEGMSKSTIEKFVGKGFIREFADFFKLDRFKKEIVEMEGFGKKSYENIINAANKARETSFIPLCISFGIPGIGKAQAKLLGKEFKGSIYEFFQAAYNRRYFRTIESFGEVLEDNIWRWANEYLRWIVHPDPDKTECNREIENLMKEITVVLNETEEAGNILSGKTFVITGDVHYFKNRAELQERIESLGGKSTGSVTGKTSYLINNDVTSTSGKNKKAKELGIPIISEEEFLEMIK